MILLIGGILCKTYRFYYGPKSGFNKILKFDEPSITLTSMAILSDKKMRGTFF